MPNPKFRKSVPTEIATIARFATALSHPRRVLIVQTILRRPDTGECLARLARATSIPQSSLQHHLAMLETCGAIANSCNTGKSVYRIHPERMALLCQMLAASLARAATSANSAAA